MAATSKPIRQKEKKFATKERKLYKEVLEPHGGKRKALEKKTVSKAKSTGARKRLVNSLKSMY